MYRPKGDEERERVREGEKGGGEVEDAAEEAAEEEPVPIQAAADDQACLSSDPTGGGGDKPGSIRRRPRASLGRPRWAVEMTHGDDPEKSLQRSRRVRRLPKVQYIEYAVYIIFWCIEILREDCGSRAFDSLCCCEFVVRIHDQDE